MNKAGKDEYGDNLGTPLHIAAEKGSTEIAALLIEAKVRSVCWGRQSNDVAACLGGGGGNVNLNGSLYLRR